MSDYYKEMKQKAQEIYDLGFELYPEKEESNKRTRLHREIISKFEQPDRMTIKQYLDNLKVAKTNAYRKKSNFGNEQYPRGKD